MWKYSRKCPLIYYYALSFSWEEANYVITEKLTSLKVSACFPVSDLRDYTISSCAEKANIILGGSAEVISYD